MRLVQTSRTLHRPSTRQWRPRFLLEMANKSPTVLPLSKLLKMTGSMPKSQFCNSTKLLARPNSEKRTLTLQTENCSPIAILKRKISTILVAMLINVSIITIRVELLQIRSTAQSLNSSSSVLVQTMRYSNNTRNKMRPWRSRSSLQSLQWALFTFWIRKKWSMIQQSQLATITLKQEAFKIMNPRQWWCVDRTRTQIWQTLLTNQPSQLSAPSRDTTFCLAPENSSNPHQS